MEGTQDVGEAGGVGDDIAAGAPADDDALYVLTAALLTPAQFPSVLADDYPEACAALGLEPYADGYGLVLGQDGDGARWTVVVDDVSLVAVAIASWDCGMEYDLSPDERSVVAALPGWPLGLSVAAPQLPPPHDPPTAADDRPPLTPPDAGSWGPAQRRLGADEIALQWASWRSRLDDGDFASPGAPADEEGTEGPSVPKPGREAPTAGDGAQDQVGPLPGRDAPEDGRDAPQDGREARTAGGAAGAPDDPARPGATGKAGGSGTARASGGANPPDSAGSGSTGRREPAEYGDAAVRRVLEELQGYLDSPPPLGRVRSGFAPDGARMLRADGPGWSLVARTDDIAFVLLDDQPGEVLPVGRGARLPALLTALEAMAVRPA
ncbi:hypothetical protein ACF1G0_29705 [Streptomyces sp. NPDC013953]|uniref:hypothetical protein n=1 Tax=Streptomyces sp. NPDC013953 TaxID=3364868 RepID=UPI0036F723BA